MGDYRSLNSPIDSVEEAKRETFITSGRLGYAAGEEALLGYYLSRQGPDGEHDFVASAGLPVELDEGWWYKFATSPEAARKREADAGSYVWDHLVELFAQHFRDGTADYLTDTNPHSHASTLRFFARENRTRRRILASAIIDMLETTRPDMRRLRVITPSRPGDPYWVFLLLPFPKRVDYRVYRDGRRSFLEACCMVTKLMNPDAVDIVGFATETARGAVGSEDHACLDARQWTKENEAEARRLQRDLQILVRPRMMRGTEYEFPPTL